jgi:hypothetical protein
MSEDLTMRECLLRDINDLKRERDEAREDAKRATYDAAQETIKVSTVKSHWIEACRERDEARDTVFRLRKQRAIARNFGEQMERERDNARRMAEGLRSAACEKRGSFKLPWEINE